MAQILLNIKDESKTVMLLDFLKTVSYISIQQVSEENPITGKHQRIMRSRLKNAAPEDFRSWDEIIDAFKVDQ